MTRVSTVRPTRSMSARTDPVRAARKAGVGSTLVGVFIGMVVGIGLAAGVAFYLMKSNNPYQPSVAANARDAKDPARTAKGEPGGADKPRFDFYKILPGVEEPKLPSKVAERPPPDKATVERAATPEKAVAKTGEGSVPVAEKAGDASSRTAKPGERFWLQAGSFTNEREAENLKAQLALSGWEAAIQPATLPDKSVRYRVRLGPYANPDELNRAKGDLTKRGVEVAVIKY